MVKKETNLSYKITSKWYSFRAKNLYVLAEKAFRQLRYPIATNFAQESIEFAGKAILEMNNKRYDKNSHDFSRAFKQLFDLYPKYNKTISKIISISDKWLKQSRNISRYGIGGLSPEQLQEGRRTISNKVIKDARYSLELLIKLERETKSNITLGIINGRVYGTSTDRYPLKARQCNQFDKNIWETRLKHDLQSTSYNLIIKKIPISKIDSTIDIVVNPFGELFPASDNFLDVIEIIHNFISTGGSFINLGGLPFWASYCVKTGARKSHVIKEIVIMDNKALLSTPLKNTLSWQMFGIKTTGDTNICSGANNSAYFQEPNDKIRFGDLERDIRINEYRGLTGENTYFTPIIRMNREDFGQIYPISVKHIGLGHLFLASLKIKTDEEVQLITDAIKGYLNWLYVSKSW